MNFWLQGVEWQATSGHGNYGMAWNWSWDAGCSQGRAVPGQTLTAGAEIGGEVADEAAAPVPMGDQVDLDEVAGSVPVQHSGRGPDLLGCRAKPAMAGSLGAADDRRWCLTGGRAAPANPACR
jgi:hypothetical protein